MAGLNFVAPPRQLSSTAMQAVQAVNASWIAVIPYAFSRVGEATVKYHAGGGHWWGESPDGIRATIDSAHAAGVAVLLKPQVFVPGGWTGGIDFQNEADWAKWKPAIKSTFNASD